MGRKDPKFVGFEHNLWNRVASRPLFGSPAVNFAAELAARRRRKWLSMHLPVAEGHDLKTRRRLVSPSASAAASATAACATGFSVRRAKLRSNRLGENRREAIIFRRHDEQGLSSYRQGQKGMVGAARFQRETQSCGSML
jgi:hypothetical protein